MKVKTAFFDYPLWIWVLIWVVFAVLARQTEAQDSSYSYWNKGHPQYGLLHGYFFHYHKARPVFRRSTLTIRYDKKLVGTLLGQRIWEAANDINKEICFKASRLTSLIPRPRVHLIRFHGVFAPHFKYRSLIVPQPSLFDKTSHTEQKKSKQPYSIGWAKILKRVFDIDIQTCPKCGGQIKIISSILNPQVIKKILIHLEENAKIPGLAPPRGPPEIEESFVTI